MPCSAPYAKPNIRYCLLLCCLFFFKVPDAAGEEISLDGSWLYSTGRQEDAEKSSGFNQRYGLGWNPRLTRAISFDLNMNYSRYSTTGFTSAPASLSSSTIETDEDLLMTADIIRETFSPTGSLQIENDLFLAEITGFLNRTTNSRSADQLDRNWETLLASNWDYLYWPSLSFNFGQNWLSDSEEVPLTDTSRIWSEFVTEWEADEFSSYYSYYSQVRDDNVELSRYDERKHFGRLDYSRSFFLNRLNLNLSGQLTDSVTKINVAPGRDETLINIGLSQAMAGVVRNPDTGTVPRVPGLTDGNRNSVVYRIKPRDFTNLGVKADIQTVNRLYLYTGPIDPPVIAETGALRWDLYGSDDGINWRQEISSPATTYNQDLFRYEVNVGGLQRIYLKLVVTAWPAAVPISITEIEAYRSQDGTGGSFNENQESTRTLAEMNLRYTPYSKASLSYSLIFDNSEINTGNDRRRIFQSGTLRYELSPYFSPALTINNTVTTNSAIADTSQLSYGLTAQSILLPTLEANLGLTRNENYSDNRLESANHTLSLYLNAAIYPNLDSTLDLNLNFNNNEAAARSSENISLRWTVTARPRPTLLVDFIAEHGSAALDFAEIIDSPESGGRATLNVNWRPSELFSLLGNGSLGYGEAWENYNSLLLDANVSVLRTSKTQLITGYRINSSADETTHNLNANWSWNISKYLTMQSLVFYLIGEEHNSWFFNLRLTSRF